MAVSTNIGSSKTGLANTKLNPNQNDLSMKAVSIVEQGAQTQSKIVDGYSKDFEKINPSDYSSTITKYVDDMFDSYVSMAKSLGINISKQISKLAKLEGVQKLKGLAKGVSSLINKVKASANDLQKRIENNLLGGRSLNSVFNQVKQYVNTVKAGALMTKEFIQNPLNALNKYAPQSSVLGEINKLVQNGKMYYTDAKTVYNIVRNNDWKSLTGIVNGLEAIGGTSIGQLLKPIVDLQATGAFVGNLFNKAAESGLLQIPGIWKEFKNAFKSRSAFSAAVNAGLFNAALRGDIKTAYNIVKMLREGEVTNKAETVRTILENYKLDVGYNYADAIKFKTELFDTLNKIDKNWYKAWQNGKECTQLYNFQNVSADARMLLTMETKGIDINKNFKIELMIADSYKEENIHQLVERTLVNY